MISFQKDLFYSVYIIYGLLSTTFILLVVDSSKKIINHKFGFGNKAPLAHSRFSRVDGRTIQKN
jgi:hypothetical protein